MKKKRNWSKWCFVLSALLMVPAVLADLNLTTATWDMSSVGWGLGGNLALDDNLTTRSSCLAHALPPDPTATGTNEWLWVDLGADMQLTTVAVDFQDSAAVDYTIRLLTEAQATTLGLTTDGTAGGGVDNWTTIATGIGLPDCAGDGDVGPNRKLAGTADVWNFTTGTAVIPDNTTGTATVNVLDPIGRYLLIDTTLASDEVWGNVSIWEIDVVPEPTTLALLGMGYLGLIRRRH
jgi:hypothetical protein